MSIRPNPVSNRDRIPPVNATIGPSGLNTCDTLAPRTLSLPLHVGLTNTQTNQVISSLIEVTVP